MMKNKRSLGQHAEQIAAQWLQEQHLYQILELNYHARRAEIDIIALDDETLVFIEVRSLHHRRPQDALASITPQKQQRILFAAQHYLAQHYPDETPHLRFDSVGVTFQHDGHIQLQLIKGAFAPF